MYCSLLHYLQAVLEQLYEEHLCTCLFMQLSNQVIMGQQCNEFHPANKGLPLMFRLTMIQLLAGVYLKHLTCWDCGAQTSHSVDRKGLVDESHSRYVSVSSPSVKQSRVAQTLEVYIKSMKGEDSCFWLHFLKYKYEELQSIRTKVIMKLNF